MSIEDSIVEVGVRGKTSQCCVINSEETTSEYFL